MTVQVLANQSLILEALMEALLVLPFNLVNILGSELVTHLIDWVLLEVSADFSDSVEHYVCEFAVLPVDSGEDGVFLGIALGCFLDLALKLTQVYFADIGFLARAIAVLA